MPSLDQTLSQKSSWCPWRAWYLASGGDCLFYFLVGPYLHLCPSLCLCERHKNQPILRRQITGTGTTGTRQYVVSSNPMNNGYLESYTTRRGGKVILKETWYAIEGVTLTERGLPITTVPMSSKAASTDDSSMNSTWHWPKNRPVFSSSAKHMLLISPHFPKMSRIASCRYIGRAICALLHVTRAVILKEFTMIFF